MSEEKAIDQFVWLKGDTALHAVLDALDAASDKARIVGGAVRNSLLGLPVADIDIATVWPPEQVIEKLEKSGLKAVPTGLSHGTITAVSDSRPFEITTLRVDLATDGRRADVAFTSDWTSDAARRDFTINALYLGSDGKLFDPLGGLQDVEAKRVRFIGQADERICEDYLRILRFFRFHAQFARGGMDREGLAACIRGRIGIRRLSSERVRAELLRLLSIEECAGTVETFARTGLLTDLLGGVAYVSELRRLERIERTSNWPPDPLLRLAVLGCKIREDAARLASRLRLSKAETKRISKAIDGFSSVSPDLEERACKILLYRLGPKTFRDRVLVAWANAGDARQNGQWLSLYNLPDTWDIPKFPIQATSILARGVKPGKRVGEILRAAEKIWVEAGFPKSDAALERILNTALESAP